MNIYNPITKTFSNLSLDKEVRIYVCGPTVYDEAHIGHARSAVFFDFLRRYLILSGHNVIFMKNITDIDDKILKKHFETKESIDSITQKYISSYFKCMEKLNVIEDLNPRATNHLNSMEKSISNLIEKGLTYTTKDGIYLKNNKESIFNIKSDYFVSRIETSTKRNKEDFVLWKFDQNFNFPSKLGNGRPGWHIECSSMIKDLLAYSDKPYGIDIHGGGKDLMFPHHENENKQFFLETGKPISKYWIHHGFINVKNEGSEEIEKMSKSLNNYISLPEILEHIHGEALRFFLLFHHYRADILFSLDELENFKIRYDNLNRFRLSLKGIEPVFDEDFISSIGEALNNDFNVSEALSLIENLKRNKDKGKIVFNFMFLKLLFGLFKDDSYFSFGIDENSFDLAKQRAEFKKNKQFKEADEIRSLLNEKGIFILDNGNDFILEKRTFFSKNKI